MKNKSIITIIVLILLLLGMATYHFLTIEAVYEKCSTDYLEIIDSLNKENYEYQLKNDSINFEIKNLQCRLDSLNDHKQILEDKIHDFTITYDVMEGVTILRQNL